MNFVKLVFEEHICRIDHKKMSMTLSTTSRIWRETSRALYLPRMTPPEVAIALYIFFALPRFKQREGENFHSCNDLLYSSRYLLSSPTQRQILTSWCQYTECQSWQMTQM